MHLGSANQTADLLRSSSRSRLFRARTTTLGSRVHELRAFLQSSCIILETARILQALRGKKILKQTRGTTRLANGAEVY